MEFTEQLRRRQLRAIRLLAMVCGAEALTGLLLLVDPRLLAGLLLGARLEDGAAMAVGRVGGSALLALSIACWPLARLRSGLGWAFAAMLLYSALVTILLSQAGWAGAQGPLLLPAVVAHLLITGLLAYASAAQRP